MKAHSIWMAAIALVLAGCGSLPEMKQSVREKFSGTPPRTKVVAADQRATYEAARTAAERMNFRFVRGGAAQGQLEAISGLASSDSLRSSRQLVLIVKLDPVGESETEVQAWLREIIEDDSSNAAGRATESPLRDTPLYEVFFRNVQQALDAGKS